MNTNFEPLRELTAQQLSDGAAYAELAAALNESGATPPKGGKWSTWGAYNAARRLGLSSVLPCKAQPRASRTARKENLRHVANAIRRAIDAGTATELNLRTGAIHPTAKLLGLTSWTWRAYRRGAMLSLGMSPPPPELPPQ